MYFGIRFILTLFYFLVLFASRWHSILQYPQPLSVATRTKFWTWLRLKCQTQLYVIVVWTMEEGREDPLLSFWAKRIYRRIWEEFIISCALDIYFGYRRAVWAYNWRYLKDQSRKCAAPRKHKISFNLDTDWIILYTNSNSLEKSLFPSDVKAEDYGTWIPVIETLHNQMNVRGRASSSWQLVCMQMMCLLITRRSSAVLSIWIVLHFKLVINWNALTCNF